MQIPDSFVQKYPGITLGDVLELLNVIQGNKPTVSFIHGNMLGTVGPKLRKKRGPNKVKAKPAAVTAKSTVAVASLPASAEAVTFTKPTKVKGAENKSVISAIAKGAHSHGQIVKATGLDKAEVTSLLTSLMAAGSVTKSGERRGTKYAVTNGAATHA